MSEDLRPPGTRAGLFALAARLIGWGSSSADVEKFALEMERHGISLIPTLLLTADQQLKNPYSPPQELTE